MHTHSAADTSDSPYRSFKWYCFIGGLYLCAYVALDRLVLPLRYAHGVAVWYAPPALTFILLMWQGRRFLPVVALASLCTTLLAPITPLSGLIFSALHVLVYGGAALVLHDWLDVDLDRGHLHDVLWFIVWAIVLAPLLIAVGGVTTLVLLDGRPVADFQRLILTFWIGDAIGIISVAPTVLAYKYLFNWSQRSWFWHRLRTVGPEVYGQSIAIILTVSVSFLLANTGNISGFYLSGVPLLWIAMRGGFARSTLAVSMISLSTIAGVYAGWVARFAVVDLQLFILTISLTGFIVGVISSERQKAEQRLHKSEQYFRSLITFSSDLISIIDQHGIVQYESPSVHDALGYTDGLVGHDVLNYVHPHDVDRVRGIIQNLLTTSGISPVFQYRFRHADGSWRWIESVANHIKDQTLINGLIVNSRDITQRREAEEHIRLQTDLLNQVSNAVVVIDTALRVTFWNRAAELLYGWSADETKGMVIFELDLFDVPDTNNVAVVIRRMLEQGETWQGEVTIQARNHVARPIYLSTTSFYNDSGHIQGIIGIANDITDRKLAQQRLIESEQYFRSLIENASDLISIIDEHGLIHYHSPAIERVLGYTTGLVGRNAFDYVHPADRAALQSLLQRKADRNHGSSPVQYRFRHTDGSWRMIETVSNMLNPEARSNLRIVLNSRDITERKQLEDALTLIAQGVADTTGMTFYRSLVLQLSRALQVTYASIGLFDHELGMVNIVAACENNQSVPTFSYPVADSPAERVMRGSKAIYQENVQAFFSLDPALKALDIHGYLALPLGNQGEQTVGILCVMHTQPIEHVAISMSLLSIFAQRITSELKRKADEDDRLQMERKLMETQKLESLGLLAGGIAHDFNNVLMTIMGNVGLALLDLEEDSPLVAYLQTVETAARHAADLCRQMLAYSGKSQVLMTSIDLNHLIEEMIHLLHVSIGKHVTLELHFDPFLPTIKGDLSQVRQIVMNLIVNAAEAVEPHKQGRVRVETGTHYLDALDLEMAGSVIADDLEPGDFVYLDVTDNGVGMDVETLAKIFDPFFTTKFTGRGLGLAAVQGIVRSHRGVLRVWTEVGQGCTFRVLMPAFAQPPAPVEAAPVLAQRTTGEGIILVIDDDEANCRTVAQMVEALGFTALPVVDGATAIKEFKAQQPAIAGVLLDLSMPGMTGEATYAELRALDQHVPIMVMSGHSKTQAIARFNHHELVWFLQKPYQIEELAALLQHMLEDAAPPSS